MSQSLIYSLINLVGNIFELYIAVSFFSKFSAKKASNRSFVILCCLFTGFQFLSNQIFLAKSNLVMLCMIIFILLISALYKMKLTTRIFSSILVYMFFALPEFIIAMLATSLFKIDLSAVQSDMSLFALCTFTSKFFTFAIVKVLNFNNKKNINWLPKSLAIKTIPLPLSSLLVQLLLFNCCYVINDAQFRIMTLASCCALIIANIFVFYIIDKQNDYIKTKESLNFAQAQIKMQVQHYSELYQYQNDLKAFKHDTKNKMIALLGLINEQDSDKAIASLKADINFLNDDNQTIIDTGNPVIDAIIQAKANLARSLNIPIKTNIRLNKPILIDEFELAVLIGNALDNAIEATQKISKGNKFINITLLAVEDHLSVSVINPVENNIDTENMTTTKQDKSNHGYGIKSMETIAEKYGGNIYLSSQNNTFEFSANILNRSNQSY